MEGLIAITFHINEESLIERVSGLEHLNKLKPVRKLKALQGMRNKTERLIFETIMRVKSVENRE